MILLYFVLITAFSGSCETAAYGARSSDDPNSALLQAKQSLADDQIQDAKEGVREILRKDPEHQGAGVLMAEIIDREISTHMETETLKVVEEYTEREKADAVKTWLERSRALLEAKQYDQAILAAEKVFVIEPENIEASGLVDRIREDVTKEGKAESLVLKEMYRGEIDVRVRVYMKQAEQWMNAERWGMAGLALEKILLLDPQNQEALKMHERFKARQK